MVFARALSTSVVHYALAKSPLLKKYPVTLRIQYPCWTLPALHTFSSAKEITDFLSQPKQFLYDPATGYCIRANQVELIDPNITYEIAGSGLPYREKDRERDRSTREQARDIVFERKSALALKELLEKEDPKVKSLPRVIKSEGKGIAEWEGIYELSDGCIVFLESKYRMSRADIDDQCNRISKSLAALGKETCDSRLYLAAYYWPDEDCISYAHGKGYGIIQPNGADLTISFKAEVRKSKQKAATHKKHDKSGNTTNGAKAKDDGTGSRSK